MSRKITRRIKTITRRVGLLFRPKNQQAIAIAVGLLFVAGIIISVSDRRIQPSAYRPLLTLIAKGESAGNYNAFYGNVTNMSAPRFTGMTVAEVMDWQRHFVAQGAASSAVGRYQIIDSTLRSVVASERIDSAARFDEALQDRLAMALINRRGAHEFVAGQISREQFAARLTQEWAALPLLDGQSVGQSFYEGDGLNRSRITVEEFRSALDQLYRVAR